MFTVKEKPVAKTAEFVDKNTRFEKQDCEVLLVSQKEPPTTWVKLKVSELKQPLMLDGGLIADLFKKKGSAYELPKTISIGIEAGKVVL